LLIQETGKNLTTEKIPLDDPKTYDLFSVRLDCRYIPVLKKQDARISCKAKAEEHQRPCRHECIYRPGPMKLIPDFIDKRTARNPITYLHPTMESYFERDLRHHCLSGTGYADRAGCAGFSLAQADNMRKAMGKKIKEKMMQIKEEFHQRRDENNVQRNGFN
jgi:DNA polymerase-3 subunit alpha